MAKAQKKDTIALTAPITIEVSRDILAYTLCAGFEGGIGYWAKIVEYIEPPKDANLFDFDFGLTEDDGSPSLFRYIHYPMCAAGGGVILGDAETEDGDPFDFTVKDSGVDFKGLATLDYAAVLRGVKIMAETNPRHFGDMIGEGGDSITGDVLIQCAVFGYVVFG